MRRKRWHSSTALSIKGLVERLELVANSEFARISYTEAIEILKKNNKKFQYPVEWGVA